MTIESALRDAQILLAEHTNSSEAKLEAQLLLQNLLKVNRAWLISHQNDALQPNIHEAYSALVNRRATGEPIAYILGIREFYGLNLKVTPATLIPRSDTETLVDTALAKIPPQKKLNICDLGTGTGAIALAIAKHRPQVFVLALDASQQTLDVAIENAKCLKIHNVDFVLSNWFSALSQKNNLQKFDLIVSNPPYIEANDAHLSQGDLRFEPISALASGQDGLDDIRCIISQAPQYLNAQGWLLLEHGYNHADKVAALLDQAGFSHISHAEDLAGINRVTLGCISS
jgi:release factor glutamine methyltransferase